MSLSLLAKSFVFALLALASAWAGREYAIPLANYFTDVRDITARDARISKRSIAYRLPQDGSLEFVFSQPVTVAKILVHPSVGEDVRAREAGFVYGLRVRWIAPNGEVISAHEAYVQADSPDKVFASGDVWRFFRTRPELVAGQDQLVVESASPAARIELEAFDVEPGIIGVDARVFEQHFYFDNQALASYRRLSEDTRALLAAPNAFPHDMLTEKEQGDLRRNHWRSVGPAGVVGKDFTMLILYEALREDVFSDGTANDGTANVGTGSAL